MGDVEFIESQGQGDRRGSSRNLTMLASLAVALILFVVALTARHTSLGAFSWPDEQTWLERSAAFILAVEQGDPAGTYLADHPGVVPMWGFGSALALHARATGDPDILQDLADGAYSGDYPTLLAAAATFTVLFTSVAVVVAYALLIPLLGRTGAALAGLFLALDPFYLTHSRIVHVDGILSSAMLVSALAFLVYIKRPGRRRYLLLSGLAAGLAFLTKAPSLFLIPWTALVLGLQWLHRRRERGAWGRIRQLAGAFALWLAIGWGTFLVLWPATWQDPLFFVWRLYRASRWGALVSHGTNFFLGRVVADPGPLFYAVVLPFRLSPLVMLLLLAGVVLVVIAWRRGRDVRLPLAGYAFLFFFTVMVSLAAKKGDRYLLPVYPVADVVAAWAVVALFGAVPERMRGRRRVTWWRAGYAAIAGAVLLSSLLWLRLAPHYGAYFNPLVGGGPVAARTFAFGQGEGLELAAEYLNEKPDGGDLLVVSFYPPQFRYYFHGDATSLRRGDWDETWQFAEYVVTYISQVQRQLPTEDLVEFFLGQTPEHVVELGGVEFARVYRSPVLLSGEVPAVEETIAGRRLDEQLALAGYALGETALQPGDDLHVTLAWQALEQLGLAYDFELQLVDGAGAVVWQQAGAPFDGYFPTWWWRPGRTLYVRYRVPLRENLAPGTYRLLVRAYDAESGATLTPTAGEALDRPGYLPVTGLDIGAGNP
jgi:hypothetical protein